MILFALLLGLSMVIFSSLTKMIIDNHYDLSLFYSKPKEVLIKAVKKFLKEKLKEKGFVFSDSQLKFTKAKGRTYW
jgi:hypothetical protein